MKTITTTATTATTTTTNKQDFDGKGLGENSKRHKEKNPLCHTNNTFYDMNRYL